MKIESTSRRGSHIELRLFVLSIRLGSYLDVSDTPFCFVNLLQSALQLATRKRKTNNPGSILWSDCRRWFSQTLQLTCFLQFPWLDVILIFVLPSTPFSRAPTGRGAGTKGNHRAPCNVLQTKAVFTFQNAALRGSTLYQASHGNKYNSNNNNNNNNK